MLLHDLVGDEHDLPVQQQEAGQAVPFDEAHFLVEADCDLRGDEPVSPDGGFETELLQVAQGCVPGRHVGFGQGVAEVGAQVEGAAFGDTDGVSERFGAVAEQFSHLTWGFQGQVRIGVDERQGLVEGQVAPHGNQSILQPVARRGVVMHVVGGNQGNPVFPGQANEFAVAGTVAVQELRCSST